MRWQRLILAAVALGAFGLSGCFLVRYGVELVVLPGRFHEVLRLHDLRVRQRFDVRSADEKLTRAADELIRLQRPGFAGGSDYGVLPVRTHEGAEAFVLTYRAGEPPAVEKPGMLEAGLHLVAIDGRGRLFGSDFQSPPSRHFFGPHFTQTPGDGGSVIAVSGDPAYFLSVDARGVVPRGAVMQFPLGAPIDPSAPLVSSGNCATVRRWLASIQDPPPTTEETTRLLRSSFPGDLFRALHAIERLGPAAAHLARPLLAHADADLRARTAAVLGNDETLWADLVPMTADPAIQVRTAARFALLRAADPDTARAAFLHLLREDIDLVREADFDHDRLLSPEVAAVLLDHVEKSLYAPERFVGALRPQDLQPLVPRLEELWRRPAPDPRTLRVNLVRWLVRAEARGLDALLLEAIQREYPGEPLGLADIVLRELLERPSPLGTEGAVETLLECQEKRLLDRTGLGAQLLLIHWHVPGAEEKLLARPCKPGTDCLSDLLNAPLPPSLRATLEALARRERGQ